METRYSEAGGGNDITIHDRKSNESSTRACTLALVLRVRRDICRDKRDTGATVPRTTHAMHATQYAALLVWRWEDWYLVPVGAVCGSTIRCQSAKVQRLLQPSRSPTTYWLLHALLYNCILYMYIVLLWIVAFSIYFYSTYRT
jgi:hypothetical protein